MAISVEDNPGKLRYEIRDDGRLAGYTMYTLRDDVADFVHTEVFPRFEGRGLASVLVRDALDDVRRRGWSIRTTCPYVRRFVEEHPEYRDLVAQNIGAGGGVAFGSTTQVKSAT
ncbi:MAG: GNAT family N-acetyltransferase [Acidimicrobiia bacterium]